MKKIIHNTLLLLIFSLSANSQILEKVMITIDQDSIAVLEANPFKAEDVHGKFVADTGIVPVPEVFDTVELNYRGAYSLKGLIDGNAIQRNWKVKVPKSQQYLNRKEWNFNYQNHVRQFMADYIMKSAGVPMSESKLVKLWVNGVSHGLYLRVEDCDNKNFLVDKFGSNKGDIYKVTYDSPADTANRCWADLTYLGPNDADYFLHYNKKTNNEFLSEFDYSSIRKFTELINFTPDEQFEDSIKKNFNWEKFLKYMVVGNFISNWDGYPQRPKNYWLYNNPLDNKWNFIPWDMDATFQLWGGGPTLSLNMMGKTCSVLFYMDKYEPYKPGAINEPKERPLTWRIMKVPFFRNYYLTEYKKAMTTYLSKTKINSVLDSISAVVKLNESNSEWNSFQKTVTDTKTFLTAKTNAVNLELSTIPIQVPAVKANDLSISIFPNPAKDKYSLSLTIEATSKVSIDLFDLTGRHIQSLYNYQLFAGKQCIPFSADGLNPGNYLVKVKVGNATYTEKLMVL